MDSSLFIDKDSEIYQLGFLESSENTERVYCIGENGLTIDDNGTFIDLMPANTTYVVIRLDPVGTLASLEDEETLAKAALLPSKKYVGYINMVHDDAQFQSVDVRLLRQGLPEDSPYEFATPEMSVPVLPNTKHPSSREPLVPSRPLPWQDCYHVSFDVVSLRIPTLYVDAAPATTLPLDKIG
ncbi:hypothetical protein H0H81_003033 [Sphagnurus paluster]|uniref:Uncharacterized protein n=1 Tax=Sphagnurus paluster TaxID=117069 RepID=A0A9P7KGI1_9AGAR|nr:hypothetical protein H0H81_003033 [Sphagnurus paluster]